MSKRRTPAQNSSPRSPWKADQWPQGRLQGESLQTDAVHPIQVSQWKKQLLEGASELFAQGQKDSRQRREPGKEGELFKQMASSD